MPYVTLLLTECYMLMRSHWVTQIQPNLSLCSMMAKVKYCSHGVLQNPIYGAVAPVSLISIHLTINWINSCKQNRYYDPLFGNFIITRKLTCISECVAAHERYVRTVVFVYHVFAYSVGHCGVAIKWQTCLLYIL